MVAESAGRVVKNHGLPRDKDGLLRESAKGGGTDRGSRARILSGQPETLCPKC